MVVSDKQATSSPVSVLQTLTLPSSHPLQEEEDEKKKKCQNRGRKEEIIVVIVKNERIFFLYLSKYLSSGVKSKSKSAIPI